MLVPISLFSFLFVLSFSLSLYLAVFLPLSLSFERSLPLSPLSLFVELSRSPCSLSASLPSLCLDLLALSLSRAFCTVFLHLYPIVVLILAHRVRVSETCLLLTGLFPSLSSAATRSAFAAADGGKKGSC